MANVKNRKVSQARFHAGAHIGQTVLNTVKPGINGVIDVEITDLGIWVKSSGKDGTFIEDVVPFGNTVEIRLLPEEPKPDSPKSKK